MIKSPAANIPTVRTFEKMIRLTTQGQYQADGHRLRLFRYRMIVDGAPGPWRKVTATSDLPDAFWPRVMLIRDIDPDDE